MSHTKPPALSPRQLRLVLLALCAAALFAACAKVPFTGRTQYNLIPDAIMIPLGASSYDTMLSGVSLIRKTESNETLSTVGKRLSQVADEPDYEWEFKLVNDDETINAWCLPGGKVAVYSGLLPVARNEAGLAFVVGHEIGHAKAKHSSERLSQQLTMLGGLAGLNLYLANKTELSGEQRAILLAALGVGAEVGVLLPFSRQHEYESDIIGMMYMATAGYPPEQSIAMWKRMESAQEGGGLPTFLSTHPSDEKRIANMEDWLSKAQKRYERNALQRDTTATLWD